MLIVCCSYASRQHFYGEREKGTIQCACRGVNFELISRMGKSSRICMSGVIGDTDVSCLHAVPVWTSNMALDNDPEGLVRQRIRL